MNFSTNQVRNFYVVKSKDASISNESAVGAALVKGIGEDFVIQYMGAGGLTRSDLINKKSVYNLTAKKAIDTRVYLRKDKIAIDTSLLDGVNIDTTKIPVGTDLLTRINIFQWGSISQEDQYVKHGIVTTTAGMSAAKFYKEMAKSLLANSVNDQIQLFDVKLSGELGGVTIEVPIDTAYKFKITATDTAAAASITSGVVSLTPKTSGTVADLNAAIATAGLTNVKVLAIGTVAAVSTATAITATAITLTEKPQPWKLGMKEAMPLQYNLSFTSSDVYSITNGINKFIQIPWVTGSTQVTEKSILPYTGNGQLVADMEYFFMGERGDDYRMMGFPNVVDTKYLVDPTKEYNIVDFDFKYVGTGVDNFESVKHITLAFEEALGTFTVTNVFINDLESMTGLTLADLA